MALPSFYKFASSHPNRPYHTMTTMTLALIGLLLGGEAFWQGYSFPLLAGCSSSSAYCCRVAASTRPTVVFASSHNSQNNNNPTQQDWDATRYDAQYSFVYEYGRSLVDLADLRPGESVLDVGCGTGVLTAALSAQNAADHPGEKVYALGMDADPRMVDTARANFPHLDFMQGDARNFTLTRPVDVLFSNAALHWIPCADLDRTMACLARALQPNGRFIVELGGEGNVGQIVTALQHVLQERHNGATFDLPWCFPTIADFTKHMENNGIEPLSAVLFDRPTVLEGGKEGLNDWLRMFAGQFLLQDEPSHLDDTTLAAVNDRLRTHLFNDNQQQWTADYRRLRVVGRKR
jgi:trans-aconitate methyltransferase